MSDPMPPEAINDIAARLKAVDDFNPLPWTSKYDSFGVEINFGPTFQVEDANGDLVFATDSIQDLADLLRFAPTDLRRLLDENARLNAELAEFANTITAPAKQLAEIGAMVGYPDPPGIADAVRAELDRVIREAAADKAKLNAILTFVTEPTSPERTAGMATVRRFVEDVMGVKSVPNQWEWMAARMPPPAAPEMPRPPAEEATVCFAPYGSTATACRVTIPKRMPWNFAAGDWDSPALTTRRAITTCPRCLAGFEPTPEAAILTAQPGAGDAGTSGTGSGRGTGVLEAENSAQVGDAYRPEYASTLLRLIDDAQTTTPFYRRPVIVQDGAITDAGFLREAVVAVWRGVPELLPALPVPSTEEEK